MPQKIIINFKALEEILEEPIRKAALPIARELAESRFDTAKETFLKDFLSHPVSEELESGPKYQGGSLPIGNLFSFIGFNDGEDPVGELYQFLDDEIYLSRTATYDKARRRFIFTVGIPSKDEIADQTPMPWGTARSWVFGIEAGIQGLNHYIFSQSRDLGRSTGGTQSKTVTTLAPGGYKAQRYLSDLLNTLRATL